MTNYSERLDRILSDVHSKHYDTIDGADDCRGSILEAKKTIASLIKELAAEAKPVEHIDVYTYSNAQTYGDIRKIAIDEFEQNLLKALEETNGN